MTYNIFLVERSGHRTHEGKVISNKKAVDVHRLYCEKWGLDGTQLDVEPVEHNPKNIITSVTA